MNNYEKTIKLESAIFINVALSITMSLFYINISESKNAILIDGIVANVSQQHWYNYTIWHIYTYKK